MTAPRLATPGDERLDRALRTLPVESASGDFTARTLARLERVEGSRRRRRRARRWLVATAATVALAGGIGWLTAPAPSPERAAETLRQTRELRRDLEELRREAEALTLSGSVREAPILYLGGDDQVDVVLDLRPWADQLAAEVRPAARPSGSDRRDG